MAAETRGSIYTTSTGVGIRWPEAGKRKFKSGFKTRTEARRWFNDNVAPRLRTGAPSAEITFDAFCDIFLERHGATIAKRTKGTLEERLAPARDQFGDWTLAELEGAADDVAAWRASLSDTSRYRLTSALRQALGAAVRWRYIGRNPAVDAGRNPQPRAVELRPFDGADEIDVIDREMDELNGAAVVFGAETGLRPEEWIAMERRDVDRVGRAVAVQRKFASGELRRYTKTERSRRRVPLTDRALAALERVPPRLDTPLQFPATQGGYIDLDNWRSRDWYDALDAAGIERRGPYHLRHTFATEALAAGISVFELSRLMGTSIAMIDRTYGHLARDSEDAIRARLNARGDRDGVEMASASDGGGEA
jgi:integrase